MVENKGIYKVLGSRTFLRLCIGLIIVGSITFLYFTFKNDIKDQNEILEAIQKAQTSTEKNGVAISKLTKSNKELVASNTKLVKSVCVLQDQIELLGAVPVVERDPICDGILINQ